MSKTHISPNGAPQLTGAGVAAVQKHIQDAFHSVRQEPITTRAYDTSNEIAISENPDDVFARMLESMDVAVVEDASPQEETSHTHERPAAYRRDRPSWFVRVPKESAQELIANALAQMQKRTR